MDLKYFIGKACTISTVEINFRFKEQQMMDYFMGMVESIDESGIWITHPITKCKSYIFLSRIVSISEEQILYENDPEDAKIIEEYRKEKPITAAKTVVTDRPQKTEPSFINPANLAKMAKEAKESFSKGKQ
jgi:hypothetical protein